MFCKLQLVITNQNKKRLSPEMEASRVNWHLKHTHVKKKKSGSLKCNIQWKYPKVGQSET